jgi:hypothetical protein
VTVRLCILLLYKFQLIRECRNVLNLLLAANLFGNKTKVMATFKFTMMSCIQGPFCERKAILPSGRWLCVISNIYIRVSSWAVKWNTVQYWTKGFLCDILIIYSLWLKYLSDISLRQTSVHREKKYPVQSFSGKWPMSTENSWITKDDIDRKCSEDNVRACLQYIQNNSLTIIVQWYSSQRTAGCSSFQCTEYQ